MTEKRSLQEDLETVRARMDALWSSVSNAPPEQRQPLDEAIEELSATVEELQAANEQLIATQHQLEVQQQRYRDLFNLTPYGYLITSLDGIIQEVNHMAARLLQAQPSELTGKPFALFVSEAEHDRLYTRLSSLREGEEVESWETRLRARSSGSDLFPDGDPVPFHASIIVTGRRNSDGELDTLCWLFHDITEQKRMEGERERLLTEAQMRREEAEESARETHLAAGIMQTLIRTLPTGVIICDADGGILLANPAAQKILGGPVTGNAYGPREGYTLHRPDGERLPTSEMVLPRAIDQGQITEDVEILVCREDGTDVTVLASGAPVVDQSGEIVSGVMVFQDITGRRKMEQTLRRRTVALQERNEELNAFAHTVAHDLKNPLGLVLGYAEILYARISELPEEETRKHLGELIKHGRKIERIIDGLLLLASVRRSEVEREQLDMGSIVEEALKRLETEIEKRGARVEQPESWPSALGQELWVEEVWVNYLNNALKYGGDTPRIELGTEEMDRQGEVRFWIRDRGPGLTQEEQETLFTPFTQLNQLGSGHGLGLSIVRRIVEKLGGEVGVESERGEGATFWFTLPMSDNRGQT